jgi:hypothetical protein
MPVIGTERSKNAGRGFLSRDQAERDTLISQQQEFVEWWDDCVGILHGAGRGHKNNAERGSFSKDQAERDTDITQQQVSRWRGRLRRCALLATSQLFQVRKQLEPIAPTSLRWRTSQRYFRIGNIADVG